MSEALLISILQFALGLTIVGTCVLIWCGIHTWMADNRKLTDKHYQRTATSWCNEHTFFDQITEYRNDFTA